MLPLRLLLRRPAGRKCPKYRLTGSFVEPGSKLPYCRQCGHCPVFRNPQHIRLGVLGNNSLAKGVIQPSTSPRYFEQALSRPPRHCPNTSSPRQHAPRAIHSHMEECSASFYHKEALQKLAAAVWNEGRGTGDWMDAVIETCELDRGYLKTHGQTIQTGCERFEIYCLRHSALTMLAESGCDAFTLARIAGHSSITITQRYCHPQADAIERAFGKLSDGNKIGHTTELLANKKSDRAV